VALEAATKNAAHPLRLAETVGQVDPGYVADLLVLAGNPAGDIRHLEKPVMVVRNGVAYPIEQLLTDEVRWRRDKRAIRAVLERQVIAWNEKDLRRFMQGYWQNDNLIFASGGEVMRGWQSALDRYLKNYDTAAKIGRLNFRIEQIDSLGDGWAKVFGEWEVTRAMEKLSGLFTLIMERQAEGWRIVHDHTSSAAK
jgi:ketosteroid isomerase-like protein